MIHKGQQVDHQRQNINMSYFNINMWQMQPCALCCAATAASCAWPPTNVFQSQSLSPPPSHYPALRIPAEMYYLIKGSSISSRDFSPSHSLHRREEQEHTLTSCIIFCFTPPPHLPFESPIFLSRNHRLRP